MKNGRSAFGCLVAICGVLALLFFTGNDSTGLIFSVESGFYDEPFELELHSPIGTEIYYTLDGSDPDESSTLYSAPIIIDDATAHDNVYSMRTDMTAEFTVIPTYLIDKCTVVKAAYLDADGNFSNIETASYFIDYDNKSGYANLNILSIVTDPDNLFDYNAGIYVLGEGFDTYPYKEDNITEWWYTSSNFSQKGREWERIANIEIFDSKRNLLLNQKCGLRIQGGWNRVRLPKSLSLYAREEYGGKGRFYADLFGTDYMADTITLFAGGNDYISKLRDMLVSRATADRNFASMNYEPYAMFLNGEYWGTYWLTEKYNDVYFDHYFDVEKKNVVMIKNGLLSEGEDADYDLYTDTFNYISTADLTLEENYAHACDLIDIQSFIDYYATEIYIGRAVGDWPILNEGLWRVRQTGDGKYEDGRWRWFLFDVNTALSKDSADLDILYYALSKNDMLRNLCRNDSFRKQFATTFMDIANTSFTLENTNSIIAEYLDLMEEPMFMHLKRFFGANDNSQLLNDVADIQDFLEHRRPYATQYLKDRLALTGTLAPVEVSVSDLSAGHVTLNTIEPAFDADGTWTGEYFTDYPISLTATPNDGYRFVRWENAVSSERDFIEINLDENGASIKAVFEKIEK